MKKPEIKKALKITRFTALFLCTIIGGCGILRAPESDRGQLEQELKHNEQILNTADATPETWDYPQAKRSKAPAGKRSVDQSISVIGDSVFLGAAPSFKKMCRQAIIDAKVSRQVYHGIKVAKSMNKKKRLGNTVIIALGTNGNFSLDTGQKLIDYLGKDRTIYWIEGYGKNLDIQKQVNRTIRNLVRKNSNVHLIPWAKEGPKHPGWFYQDGIHLNVRGQEGFSRFIKKSISAAP